MFEIIARLFGLFMLYCFPPLFIFLLVFTLGMKDFISSGVTEFLKNGLRRLVDR